MPDLFISYRRKDSAGHARALERELRRHYRADRVFFDQDSIEAGDVFPEVIQAAVGGCRAVIAVIGPDWLEARDAQGQLRLFAEQDFVRQELAQALQAGKRIIPVLCDNASPPDAQKLPPALRPLASIDGLPLRGKGHEYEADLQELLRLLGKFAPPDPPAPEAGEAAVSLPYLCDRADQEGRLRELVKAQVDRRSRRPVLGILHGEAHEAHRAFVERLEGFTLPRRWRGLLARPDSRFVFIPASFRASSPEAFAREFRARLCEQLGIDLLDTDEALARELAKLGAALVAPYLILRSEEAVAGSPTCLDLLRDYWRAFPDLPPGLVVICLVLVKLGAAPAPSAGGLFGGLLRKFSRPSAGTGDETLRQRIQALQAAVEADPQLVCHVLPELLPAQRSDIENWAGLPEVKCRLPALREEQIEALFGGEAKLPMDRVHESLTKLLPT